LAKIHADDSIWWPTTSCKVLELDLYMDLVLRPGPKTKTSRSHLKILEKLAEMYTDDSIWWSARLDLYVGLASRAGL
jgi:hypothetical protein